MTSQGAGTNTGKSEPEWKRLESERKVVLCVNDQRIWLQTDILLEVGTLCHSLLVHCPGSL